jgi:hypothetical protein
VVSTRRVVVLAHASERLAPIVAALVARGDEVVVLGEGAPPTGPDTPTTRVTHHAGPLDTAEGVAAHLEALRRLGPVHAFILASALDPGPPPRLGGALGHRARDRVLRALDDDTLWAEALEHGMVSPWRWLRAALAHCWAQGHGAVTVLLPGLPEPDAVPLEVVAWRDAALALVQGSAPLLTRSPVRLNAVLYGPRSSPAVVAALCATTSGPDAGGLHGAVLQAR